ncbi:MAG: DinB family protein [Planctomycetota bacterium]
MASALERVAKRFDFNGKLLQVAIEGFPDDAWSYTPDGGGNTAHWILGHLVIARRGALRMSGVDVAPEPWEEAFARDAKPEGTEGFPPITDLAAAFHAAGSALADHIASMDDETASAPAPRSFPDGSDTIGGVLDFMQFHETYHLGQIGLIRRANGLPGFI